MFLQITPYCVFTVFTVDVYKLLVNYFSWISYQFMNVIGAY